MSVTLRMPIVLKPEASGNGCEIIIPINLKVHILLQPEVLGMPPVCDLQVLPTEPDSESCVAPTPTQGNVEIDISSVEVEVVETPVESNWFVALQEQIWRHLLAGLKTIFSHTFPGAYHALAGDDG